MSKKIKTLIIVAACMIILIVGIFSVSLLTGSNKNLTVYDFRIIQADGTSDELFDKTVYLSKDGDNYFVFDVLLQASNSSAKVRFKSSDNSIAFAYTDGQYYYCEYYRAGNATITAYVGQSDTVVDTFVVHVKENLIKDITLEDNGFVVNKTGDLEVNLFNDGRDYVYHYNIEGYNDGTINRNCIRLVGGSEKFAVAAINSNNNTITFKLKDEKSSNFEAFSENFELQIVQNTGNAVKIVKNIRLKVNGYKNELSALILVVSNTPTFEKNEYIYIGNAEETIKYAGETIIDKVFLNNTYNAIYIKTYSVNSNKERQNADVNAKVSDERFLSLTKDPKGGYYKLTASANGNATFTLGAKNVSLEIIHTGEGLPSNMDEYKSNFYKETKDSENNTYFDYVYWDNRFMRTDVICDANGRVIGFGA